MDSSEYLFRLGQKAYNTDESLAITYWEQASVKGHLEATYKLAGAYFIRKDFHKAFIYASNSEEHRDSKWILGMAYLKGEYVEKDFVKAMEYLSSSARLKSEIGMSSFAFYSQYGFRYKESTKDNCKETENQENCCICYDDMYSSYVFTCKMCKKSIHLKCFEKYNKKCAYCRYPHLKTSIEQLLLKTK